MIATASGKFNFSPLACRRRARSAATTIMSFSCSRGNRCIITPSQPCRCPASDARVRLAQRIVTSVSRIRFSEISAGPVKAGLVKEWAEESGIDSRIVRAVLRTQLHELWTNPGEILPQHQEGSAVPPAKNVGERPRLVQAVPPVAEEGCRRMRTYHHSEQSGVREQLVRGSVKDESHIGNPAEFAAVRVPHFGSEDVS